MTTAIRSGPRALAALCFAALGLAAAAASAGVPAGSASFVAACLFLCPAGDTVFVVIPRHISGNPWAEGAVWLDLCGCRNVHLSRAGGGLCPGGSFRVFAEGVLLAIRTDVASPDQNGDLVVDSTDVALVRSKLGTADPGADLDGDGIVTESDVALASAHLGHASPDRQTPALRAS